MDIISFGAFTIHLTKIELEKGLSLAEEYLQTSIDYNRKKSQKNAYIAKANILFWLGHPHEAIDSLDEYKRISDEDADNASALDEALYGMFYMFITFRTCDEKYKYHRDQLIKFSSLTKDQFCLAVIYQALSWQSYFAGLDSDLTLYSRKLIDLSKKYHFTYYLGIGTIFHGASLTKDDTEQAISLIENGYQIIKDTSNSDPALMYSIYGLTLCKCYLYASQTNLFFKIIDPLIDTLIEKRERCYLSNLYMLKGESYKKSGDSGKASIFFHEALEIARETCNKRIELELIQLISSL